MGRCVRWRVDDSQSVGYGVACSACALLGLVLVLFACAIPGQRYLVVPEVRGAIDGFDPSEAGAELRLTVTSREVPTLFEARTLPLSPAADFRFDPIDLVVAGHEYSKVYRVILSLRTRTEEQVIWRAEYSRLDLDRSIELDCDLTRPARLGQPCWVRNPLRHRWLVANGARTFKRLCSECHGTYAPGHGGAESMSKRVAPRLDRIAARRRQGFDRVEVAEWIEGSLTPRQHGSSAMPVWGERLSAADWRYSNADERVGATLDPVIVFLLSIQEE